MSCAAPTSAGAYFNMQVVEMPPAPEDEAPKESEIELAERLFAEWDGGRGASKQQIELREWDDPTA